MSTHPDRCFMEAALTEARAALEAGNLPIGAAIVHGDRVIALGRNAIDVPGDDTDHAELVAIQSVVLLGARPEPVGGGGHPTWQKTVRLRRST